MRATRFTTILGGLLAWALFMESGACARAADAQTPPAVADAAVEFSLPDVRGKEVRLEQLLSDGPVALVVLRGYPGYQCPICTRQVGELLARARDFSKAGATVALVYPGEAKDLDQRAKEFLGGKRFPNNFRFLIDPGYKFTEAYQLRWNAPGETAHPASFVIDQAGKITFAEVSNTHDGRVPAATLLKALPAKQR